ncbi:MAG: transposase [Flavobacteriales bacterium]|nr:transposase [Flavobacteriales bacterium]
MDDLSLFFDRYAEVGVQRRNLPHWQQDGKLYFLTWRQEDSIPAEKREELRREREDFIRVHGDPATDYLPPELLRRYHQLFSERVQRWLDAGAGSCVLRRPVAREIMRQALHHFDGRRYRLGSFAIAGNHVHVMAVPQPGIRMSEVLHSWKSYTANAINKALGRSGTLWKAESFDHLVRSEAALYRVWAYIHARTDQGAYVERRRPYAPTHFPFHARALPTAASVCSRRSISSSRFLVGLPWNCAAISSKVLRASSSSSTSVRAAAWAGRVVGHSRVDTEDTVALTVSSVSTGRVACLPLPGLVPCGAW